METDGRTGERTVIFFQRKRAWEFRSRLAATAMALYAGADVAVFSEVSLVRLLVRPGRKRFRVRKNRTEGGGRVEDKKIEKQNRHPPLIHRSSIAHPSLVRSLRF